MPSFFIFFCKVERFIPRRAAAPLRTAHYPAGFAEDAVSAARALRGSGEVQAGQTFAGVLDELPVVAEGTMVAVLEIVEDHPARGVQILLATQNPYNHRAVAARITTVRRRMEAAGCQRANRDHT